MQTRGNAFVFCVWALAGCQTKRFEHAAAGQPSMHDLAQRRSAKSIEDRERYAAIRERAKSFTDEGAIAILSMLKTTPENWDLQSTLVQHYQLTGDIASLDSLNLWYIEHRPDGAVSMGNIDRRLDRKGYERGRALWVANVKRPRANPLVFVRAARFLEGGARPLAEAVLKAGLKAYPNDSSWTRELGIHYAQALAGSGEPFTEFNVIRVANEQEAQSPYAHSVRERLADSKDAPLLVATANGLLRLSNLPTALGSIDLAREYISQAERLNPEFAGKSEVRKFLSNAESSHRVGALVKLSPAQKAQLPQSDRLLLAIMTMRTAWFTQKADEAEGQARKALELAAILPSDPMHDVAIFEGNMTLGKVAFRRGDQKKAARYLHLAADAPADGLRWGPGAELNLARSLIDAGRRSHAADYLERIAAKTGRPQQYRAWAEQIRKGINPADMPSFSAEGCRHDPC